MNFAERLKKALSFRNMRAIDLSSKCGISKSLISKYLNGFTEAKQKNIYLIAKALNVNPLYLIGLSDEMTPPDDLKDKIKAQLDEMTNEQLEQVETFISAFILKAKQKI